MIAQAKPKQLAAFLRTDFYAFAQKCFHHLNPGARLSRNWHPEAICYQLERLVRGEVTRLIVNAPPRSLKPQIVSVALPAWCSACSRPRGSFAPLTLKTSPTSTRTTFARSLSRSGTEPCFRLWRLSRTARRNIKRRKAAFAWRRRSAARSRVAGPTMSL